MFQYNYFVQFRYIFMSRVYILIFFSTLLFSCEESDPEVNNPVSQSPTVNNATGNKKVPPSLTVTGENIGLTDITLVGQITVSGTRVIIDRGFVYSTESISSLSEGTKVSIGTAADNQFTKRISSLERKQQYYVRAYASTADTTVLSTEVMVTTRGVGEWFPYNVQGVDYEGFFSTFFRYGISLNNKGYVGFGIGSRDGSTIITPVLEFDPVTNTFTRLPDCPLTGYPAMRFSQGGKIYVLYPAPTGYTMRFDPGTKKWQSMNPFPAELSRFHWFQANGQTFVLGNNDGNKRANEIWVYNEVEDSWSKISQLPYYSGTVPPNVYGVMYVNNKVYIIAGGYGSVKLMEYDLLKDTYSVRATPPFSIPGETVDSFALSSSSYGVFFINGKIWMYNPDTDGWSNLNAPSDVEWNPLILDSALYMFSARQTYVYAFE